MSITKPEMDFLRLLAARLERLSADSRWAHRASGVRGQLLRTLDHLEKGEEVSSPIIGTLIESGLYILRHAAKEIAK